MPLLNSLELTQEEIMVITELRGIPWGKLTVVKKNGAVVMTGFQILI